MDEDEELDPQPPTKRSRKEAPPSRQSNRSKKVAQQGTPMYSPSGSIRQVPMDLGKALGQSFRPFPSPGASEAGRSRSPRGGHQVSSRGTSEAIPMAPGAATPRIDDMIPRVSPTDLDMDEEEEAAIPPNEPTADLDMDHVPETPENPDNQIPTTPQGGEESFNVESTRKSYLHCIASDDANDAYLVHLLQARSKRHHNRDCTVWSRPFKMAEDSLRPSRIRGKMWEDVCFTYEVDCTDLDMAHFTKEEISPKEICDHLSFMTSDAKRGSEVSLSKLTAKDKALFDEAKRKELDQWVDHSVLEVALRAGVPVSRIMPMRWVLTWKTVKEGEDQHTKAKARLVVKGFTDPDLIELRAEAPTLGKQSRHMLLQLGASHKWVFEVGDVKTAFLQGDKTETNREVFLEPVKELRDRYKMTQEHIFRLMGSAYGLRTAPRNWYQRVKKDLLGIDWKMHSLDGCVFLKYNKEGKLIGLCGVYVDDFLIAGDPNDKEWQVEKKKLVSLYNWGKWEKGTFNLCGVRYRQQRDGSVIMDQTEYTSALKEADDYKLPQGLSKYPAKQKLDQAGLRCLRAINGSLQWLVTNSRIDLAAKVSLSASAISNPTYGDLQEANKLIRQAQRHRDLPLVIHSVPLDNLTMGAFTDAAWAVRPDGSSQAGYLIYFADKSLLNGAEAPVSVMDWKSWKLKRKARSSLAAESQAMADAVDVLNYLRLFFMECLVPYNMDLRRTDEILENTPTAHVITDCKSLYDALERSETAGLGLAERRTSIEVAATRDSMRHTNITTKWVNSDRQLADILTKPTVPNHAIHALQQTGKWKIIFDASFTSAKNLRKQRRDTAVKQNTQSAQQRALTRAFHTPTTTKNASSTTHNPHNHQDASAVRYGAQRPATTTPSYYKQRPQH